MIVRTFGATAALLLLAGCSTGSAAPEQQRWTDATGREVPITRVLGEVGSEHCDHQSVTFLIVDNVAPGAGVQYLRDPQGVLADRSLGRFEADATLPTDARDTGYRREGRSLWIAPDAAYLVDTDVTERWPRAKGLVGCA